MRVLLLALAALCALPAAAVDLSLGLSAAGTGLNDGRQNMHVAASLDGWHLQAIHEGERTDGGSATWLLTAAREWRGNPDGWVRPVVRLGVSGYLEQHARAGCRVGYFLGAGLQLGRFELFREHVSSAGVCRPNPAMDATGVRLVIPLAR